MNAFLRRMMPLIFAAVVLGGTTSPQVARSDDKKESKKKASKFKAPKLPDGYGMVTWDVKAIEDRYTIIRCEINNKRQISFLLELKEDSDQVIGSGTFDLYDKDGVKVLSRGFSFTPNMGKKGDRVRATMNGTIGAVDRDEWVKAVKLKVVLK
jgi:hypothetical protein